ncbi:glycosyltransferase family 4 protein [Spirosoma sp. BT702]|uniref:Glycosyltransferase family 4 protein n=1 Tax=Spirosoma profusum TaxID=2771354 RepID=A0A926Y3V6_9BACT|nr:glycosyltransferase family 4 protein [Spirosoma profusum]MBD2704537.1 glycosyltransferase family 4 protein [Spirosoma profusum]
MRILIVHNLLWAHYKSAVFQALQRLVDQRTGCSVHVLQIARNERSRAGLEATANDPYAPTYQYDYELLFDRFLDDIPLKERALALLRRARAYRPDVISLTGYYDPAQILLLIWAKLNRVKVILQNESTETDHQRGGWKEVLKEWIFGRCDGFFCFGSQSADYLIRLGVPAHKILLRKSAVDNDSLRAAYERALRTRTQTQESLGLQPHNFIFVGRLISAKNLPTLVTSFANAQKQSTMGKNWGLIFLGDGPEKESLQQQTQKLVLIDSVHFLPGRPWFQVPDVLALSDILVLPSLSEPWGLVVNEAMVCGLPVIVSDRCGCVPDLVRDGQTGFIFDPDQPDLLTQLLRRFMDETVDVASMSEAARERIAPYSPEAVAQEMLNGFMKIAT